MGDPRSTRSIVALCNAVSAGALVYALRDERVRFGLIETMGEHLRVDTVGNRLAVDRHVAVRYGAQAIGGFLMRERTTLQLKPQLDIGIVNAPPVHGEAGVPRRDRSSLQRAADRGEKFSGHGQHGRADREDIHRGDGRSVGFPSSVSVLGTRPSRC